MYYTHTLLTLTIFVLAIASSSVLSCPAMCTCSDGNAFCNKAGLQYPPPGYWPDIKAIWLNENNISSLEPNYLSGFPNIQKLYLKWNPLTVLDLNIITTNPKIFVVDAGSCSIQRVIPLNAGQKHEKLSMLHLSDNKLTSIPENLSSGLPWIGSLDLSWNPLVLPGDRALVTSNTLQLVHLEGVDARGMTKKTFSGLSAVVIWLMNARITNISDAFSEIPNLTLYMDDNPLTEVRKGSFSSKQFLPRLEFKRTNLEVFEVEALDGIMREHGDLVIDDTPMACKCKYEELHRWAQSKNITLSAKCKNNAACEFTSLK